MNRSDPLQVGLRIIGITLLVGTVLGLVVVALIRGAYHSF